MDNAYRVLLSLPDDTLAVACYFCWRDDIGAPGEQGHFGFGLRNLDGGEEKIQDRVVELELRSQAHGVHIQSILAALLLTILGFYF